MNVTVAGSNPHIGNFSKAFLFSLSVLVRVTKMPIMTSGNKRTHTPPSQPPQTLSSKEVEQERVLGETYHINQNKMSVKELDTDKLYHGINSRTEVKHLLYHRIRWGILFSLQNKPQDLLATMIKLISNVEFHDVFGTKLVLMGNPLSLSF